MKIVTARPPNFDAIAAAFPGVYGPGVLFAYGDTIYNPDGVYISLALIAHETVHGERQRGQGGHKHGPLIWWDRYLTDPQFRYNEELLAHAAEYRTQIKTLIDRNLRARLLMSTAARLIAPLYNYQPPRSLTQAMRDLKVTI